MKKTVVLVGLLCSWLIAASPMMAAAALPFSDGFEAYVPGSPPPLPWFGLAGGPSTVTTAEYHSGTKSIYVTGGPYASQSAVVNLGTNYPSSIQYRAWIKINSSGSGALVGFHNQIENMAPSFNAVQFSSNDGKVYFVTTDVNVKLLDSFSYGVWHDVRVTINFATLIANVYIDGVRVGTNLPASPKNAVYEQSGTTYNFTLRKIGIIHMAGNPVYMDDFSVWATN